MDYIAHLDNDYICTEILQGTWTDFYNSNKYVLLDSNDTTKIGMKYNWGNLTWKTVPTYTYHYYAILNVLDVCISVINGREDIYSQFPNDAILLEGDDQTLVGKKYDATNQTWVVAPLTVLETLQQYVLALDTRLTVLENPGV